MKPFLGGIALGSLVRFETLIIDFVLKVYGQHFSSFPFALLLQGLDHLLLSEKDREARREKSRMLKEARLQKRSCGCSILGKYLSCSIIGSSKVKKYTY